VPVSFKSFSATYLSAEYHCGFLQSTPIGKLRTDASAYSTLRNSFGTGFVERPSELPVYSPDVIKMPSFQYFLYLQEHKKVIGARSVNREGVPA
jgi:hypothetical protein